MQLHILAIAGCSVIHRVFFFFCVCVEKNDFALSSLCIILSYINPAMPSPCCQLLNDACFSQITLVNTPGGDMLQSLTKVFRQSIC